MFKRERLFFQEGLLGHFVKKMARFGSDEVTQEKFLALVQKKSAWKRDGRYYRLSFLDERTQVVYVARAYLMRTTKRIEVLTLHPTRLG